MKKSKLAQLLERKAQLLRPPLDIEKSPGIILAVRATRDEQAELKAAAKRAGAKHVGTWIRAVLLAEARRSAEEAEVEAQIAAIKGGQL